MTMYTADRQGYRVKHITRDMEWESRQKEKGEISSKATFLLNSAEVLIIGPIPPFLAKSHLAAHPEAVIKAGERGEEVEDDDGSGDDVLQEP